MIKNILLIAVCLFILVGCTTKNTDIQIPNTAEPIPPTATEHKSDQSEMMKYYEYLNSVPTDTLFMSSDKSKQGFNDEVMSAFAISYAIAENINFDFEKGVEKENFDTITNKYFGKTVSSYDSRYTTVLDNGNVISTGWSASPYSYVLKEITDIESGAKKAIFYRVGAIFEDITHEEYLEKLQSGNFDDFGETGLVEITFYEKQDVSGEFYLQFIGVQHLGSATTPIK